MTSIHQKMSFALGTPVYLATSSNVVVPSLICCSTTFSIARSNLPDGSFLVSTNDNQYLDTVFIDLKGPGSFFSVQLVAYQHIKRGWAMETTTDNHRRFSQILPQGKVYLGLSLDQKTVQGFDLARGIYSSVDLILTA